MAGASAPGEEHRGGSDPALDALRRWRFAQAQHDREAEAWRQAENRFTERRRSGQAVRNAELEDRYDCAGAMAWANLGELLRTRPKSLAGAREMLGAMVALDTQNLEHPDIEAGIRNVIACLAEIEAASLKGER